MPYLTGDAIKQKFLPKTDQSEYRQNEFDDLFSLYQIMRCVAQYRIMEYDDLQNVFAVFDELYLDEASLTELYNKKNNKKNFEVNFSKIFMAIGLF